MNSAIARQAAPTEAAARSVTAKTEGNAPSPRICKRAGQSGAPSSDVQIVETASVPVPDIATIRNIFLERTMHLGVPSRKTRQFRSPREA